MKELQIDIEAVERCVNSSFKGFKHERNCNKIFKEELDLWETVGAGFYPTIIINNRTYRVYIYIYTIYN